MQNNRSRIYTKISSGSHGHEPTISFDPMKRMWEINVRPGGPGVHSVYIGDELVEKLTMAWNESRKRREPPTNET